MILVINLGLKSIRALVFRENGQQVRGAARPISTTLLGDRVEQDAVEWWDKLQDIVHEVGEDLDLKQEINLITVSCSASCLVPVDKGGHPLSEVIMVSDKRAHQEAAEINDLASFKEASQKHGIGCNTYSAIARIKWLKRHNPDIYNKTHKFLAPNDYLFMKLSGGEYVTDELNAEKAFYISALGDYEKNVYQEAGLDAEKLPQVLSVGADIGTIHAKIATDLGLNPKARLVLSTYDALCSVFGTGASEEGKACDVSGTVTSVRMFTQKPFYDEKSRIFCNSFPTAGGYLLGGSNNLGGGLIEWAKQCFYKHEEHPYEVMEKEARSSHLQLNGILFIPHLLGARAPTWDSTARGIYFGLERHHKRGDMMRALFESLGYSIREFIDVFNEAGRTVDSITASGGLARIPLANELKANIVGIPYHVMDEFESTCLGAAIIILVSTGKYSSYNDACSEMVKTKQIFFPIERNRGYYDDMYGLFQELSSSSKKLFSKRAKILQKMDDAKIDHIENL